MTSDEQQLELLMQGLVAPLQRQFPQVTIRAHGDAIVAHGRHGVSHRWAPGSPFRHERFLTEQRVRELFLEHTRSQIRSLIDRDQL